MVDEHSMRRWRRSDLLWGTLAIIAVLLYRPIRFWAQNAWTLSAPQDLFKLIAIELLGALALLGASAGIRVPPKAATVAIAGAMFAVFNWQLVDTPIPLAILTLTCVATILIIISLRPTSLKGLALVLTAALVLIPLVQLGVAHVQLRTSFPLADIPSGDVTAKSGYVEDVMLLVVDGYPMRAVAAQLFGHDTSDLADTLENAGFATPSVTWSQNTFTGLAIPGMVSLTQVADPASTVDWQNQKSNYSISRGNSRLVALLQSVGFRYTHIESGWNGDVCDSPDVCLHSDLLDEASWKLLDHSALVSSMERRWGSQGAMNTFTAVDHLLAFDSFGDGQNDLVYAHLMLPHPPQVVDGNCELVPRSDGQASVERIRGQLQCVDAIISDVVASLSDEVAVVIAADHGTATLGQLFKSGEEWSDEEIAERMGAFLAYRLPAVCTPPTVDTNIMAMRALMECVTDYEANGEPVYVIGLEELTVVGPETIERITLRLSMASREGR